MKKIITLVLVTFLFCAISYSQINNGLIKIKNISEKEFLEYPFFDFEKDYDKTNIIKSINGVLKLNITSGEPVILTDTIDNESDGTEIFSHFCNILDYYVIKVNYYETVGYGLVNKNDGKHYLIEELPRISPNKKYIFIYGGSLEYSPSPPVFKIWEIGKDELLLKTDMHLENGQKLINSIRWITDSSFAIQFEKGYIGEKENIYELYVLNNISLLNNNIENKNVNLVSNITTLLENANLKLQQKDLDGAIEDYTNILTLDPKNDLAYQNRGFSYGLLKKYTEAMSDINNAIEINPYNSFAFYLKGLIKQDLQDNRGAIFDFSKSIELNPKNSEAYCSRGVSKYVLKDYKGAIFDFTKAIEINPKYADGYFYRGNVKGDIKDYQSAINDFTKALEINPKYAEAYYYRGLAKIKLKKKNFGCLDFSKAGELGFNEAYDAIKKYCQ